MQTKTIPPEVITRIFSPKFQRFFWSKIDKRGPDECWPWKHRVRASGYGTFRITRFGNKQVHGSAHRIAWVLANGSDIPSGKFVLHTCTGNKRCCNPAHLKVGTHLDNMRDMAASGVQKGERNGCARLKRDDVLELRRIHAERALTYEQIAARFGIAKKYVWKIVSRRTWDHI